MQPDRGVTGGYQCSGDAGSNLRALVFLGALPFLICDEGMSWKSLADDDVLDGNLKARARVVCVSEIAGQIWQGCDRA